jgi:transcriptional regulator with GAF, ATPase, and Fis domain
VVQTPPRNWSEQDVPDGFFVGSSVGMLLLLDILWQVAPTRSIVLLLGESGTGKEMVARLVHHWSKARNGPFVVIHCAAIPEHLMESELFGYVKGAFSGATKDKVGLLELANGGTLLLDEIGDTPPSLQVKILRFIEDGEIRRLGCTKTRKVKVRIIAATNKDLPAMMARGEFREDLYYRLEVFPLRVPPLRERQVDLPELATFLLQKWARREGRESAPELAPDAESLVSSQNWPGNIRQVENFLERAAVLADGSTLTEEDVQRALGLNIGGMVVRLAAGPASVVDPSTPRPSCSSSDCTRDEEVVVGVKEDAVACPGAVDEDEYASPEAKEQAAIRIARRVGAVTTQALHETTGASSNTASKILSRMAKNGLLAKRGGGRGAHYVVPG